MLKFLIVRIIVLLCGSTLLFSCKKDIDIPFEHQPLLCIYPILQHNSTIKIQVYPSKRIDDSSMFYVENTTAYIFEHNICIDTVNLDHYGFGTSKTVAKENENYLIKVIGENYPEATVEANIPVPVSSLFVDTFSIDKGIDYSDFLAFRIRFRNNLNKAEYYAIEMITKTYGYNKIGVKEFSIASNEFYCNKDYFDFYKYADYNLYTSFVPKNLMETITHFEKFNDGEYINCYNLYFNNFLQKNDTVDIVILNSFVKGYLKNNCQIRIEVSTLTPEYYNALYSYARYNINKQQDLPVNEPVQIYSNVKGGFGFAAAYATVTDSSISSQTYKDFFRSGP